MRGVRVELARLLYWRRWCAVGLVLTGVGVVTARDLAQESRQTGVSVNQWDVPLELLSGMVTVPWLLVPIFVGLVGDVLLRDRWTGFAMLTLPRIGSRSRWWGGKMVAVLVAAMLYFAFAALLLALIGLLFTEKGWSLSEYGSTDPQASAAQTLMPKTYSPPPLPDLPPIGILLVAIYGSVAAWALVGLILAVSQRWSQPWVPLALTLGLVLVFYEITPTNGLHPLVHLFWDMHNFGSRDYAVEWWASGAVLVLQSIVAFLLGARILRGIDV